MKHMISGHIYSRIAENEVEVELQDGRTGRFTEQAEYISGEVKSADIQMCSWVGGKIIPGQEDDPMVYPTDPNEYRESSRLPDARQCGRSLANM
jgi:hypothetical protein